MGSGDYSSVRDSTRNTDRSLGPEFLGALIDQHAAALELYAHG